MDSGVLSCYRFSICIFFSGPAVAIEYIFSSGSVRYLRALGLVHLQRPAFPIVRHVRRQDSERAPMPHKEGSPSLRSSLAPHPRHRAFVSRALSSSLVSRTSGLDCKWLLFKLYKPARNLVSREATSATGFAFAFPCFAFSLVSSRLISLRAIQHRSRGPSGAFSLSPPSRLHLPSRSRTRLRSQTSVEFTPAWVNSHICYTSHDMMPYCTCD